MTTRQYSRFALLLLQLGMAASVAFGQLSVTSLAAPDVLEGDAPQLVVTGAQPGEPVTVHLFRQASVYPAMRGGQPEPVVAHAEAVFPASAEGEVNVDADAPLRGTYRGADALGLLWSGERMAPGGLADEPATQNLKLTTGEQVVVRVQAPSLRGGRWAELRMRLSGEPETVLLQDVAEPGLNGAYARPRGFEGVRLPAIVLLHGSEGGSAASARAAAVRFAHLGYAAFAMNYFAWPGAGLKDVPDALRNIPVETLAAARSWLQAQPGVQADTVAVWGVSKGAEFALVAAAHYAWIDRVVACVPSSVVWSGFGRPLRPGEPGSSWTADGKPLPFVPLHYDEVLAGKASSVMAHRQSLLAATEATRAAARIPVERIPGRILLLAGARDVVWPSGPMSAEMELALARAGRQADAGVLVYPEASHYICGTGSEPRRINPVHIPDGVDPTPEADAHAAAEGWKETRRFLSR